jgi:molybdate transport system substrate-binding protein
LIYLALREQDKEAQVRAAIRWIALVAMGTALLAAGCGGQSGQQPVATSSTAPASEIDVMVPCGQVGPFSEVVKLFEAANPDLKVEWVAENMVTITTQILAGKQQPDLFLTMGDLEMDKVEEAGLLVEGTRTRHAENSLGIMVPAENPAGVETIADLGKPEVKGITVPDPEMNSVGKHAIEALKGAGIWDRVQKKVLIARFAADGKDVVAKGQVEASIGYYPCAVEVHVEGQPPALPKSLKLVGMVPAEFYQPFWCEAGIVKGSENPEGGRKLLAFLTSPEAQEIFHKWQFVREAPEAAGR